MGTRSSAILRDLDRHKRAFDLDRDGLGESLLDLTVEGILLTLAAEQAPDGTPWPPLSPDYEKRKAKISPGNPMAYLHGPMTEEAEIVGGRAIDPGMALMIYGTHADTMQEATWFQEGNADQPARPFWGITDEVLPRVADLIDRHFDRVV